MKSIAARYSGREHVNVSSRSRRVPFQGLWIPCGTQFGLQDPRSRKDPANDTGQAAGDRPKSPDTRGLDRARCGLNLQVRVLKILVSYPDRFAVVADLNGMWRSSPPAAGVGRAHQATGRARARTGHLFGRPR